MRSSRWAMALVVMAVLLAGCGGRAATLDDLSHALVETHSALGATVIALDQLDRGRTTRAAAEVTLTDMATQISDAQASIDQVGIASAEDVADRDAVAAVIARSASVLLVARDRLQLSEDAVDRQPVVEADRAVVGLRDRLQANR